MKYRKVFLSLLSLVFLSSCSLFKKTESVIVNNKQEAVRTNFFLNSSSEQMYVGEDFILSPKTYVSSEGLTWLSSNPSIAQVSSDGKVTALKPGETTISAFDSAAIATCKINVINYDNTYFVELSTDSIVLNVGESYGVVPTLKTNDRTIEAVFSVSLFSESDVGLCEVELVDKRYIFTALKSGNCIYSFVTTVNDAQYGGNISIIIN